MTLIVPQDKVIEAIYPHDINYITLSVMVVVKFNKLCYVLVRSEETNMQEFEPIPVKCHFWLICLPCKPKYPTEVKFAEQQLQAGRFTDCSSPFPWPLVD